MDIGSVEGIYAAAGPGTLTNMMLTANNSPQLSFTNFPAGNFPVLATTNLSIPIGNWV